MFSFHGQVLSLSGSCLRVFLSWLRFVRIRERYTCFPFIAKLSLHLGEVYVGIKLALCSLSTNMNLVGCVLFVNKSKT